MKDTFDFSSYVRSGKLHEAYTLNLDPRLEAALGTFSHEYITVGSPEWDQLVATIDSVTGMEDIDLTDFLIGDFIYNGGNFSDYMEALDIRIGYEDEFEEEEPHQTSDTFAGPKGIEEIVKEVLTKRLSEIQMGFEYNPKSVTGTGKKRGPKPIAFPYYELKEKFPEHFRLQTKDKDYTMLVSRDVIEAIGQLKDAGRNARSRQLTKLQDELRSLDTQTRRVLIKGTEGQKTFPVMGKEMYILNWPVMGPNKTKEFLWLTPTQIANEGAVDFQIDEKFLD
jgi:hypothetical protein